MIPLVHIEVTSWVGMSVGAMHYYGSLVYYDENGIYKQDDVTYKMTARDAARMNKDDDWTSYKEGDISTRFRDKHEVIETGVKQAKKRFGENVVIRVGSFASGQPERTVYAPEHILAELKPVEERWFKIWDKDWDAWRLHEDELIPIDKEWQAINKKHGISRDWYSKFIDWGLV